VFAGIWLAASVFFVWQLSRGARSFESPGAGFSLAALLLCALALMWWIPNPVRNEPSDQPTRKWRFAALILLAVAVLFPLRTLVGPALLFGLPVIAVVTLLLLRQPLNRREVLYALFLALVAGLAGLGAGWITDFSPLVWAVLQVMLVLTGLLAGWGMLRHSGVAEQGVGKSLVLSAGAGRGAIGFLLGALIAVPWALRSALGGASEDWVRAPWQPSLAISLHRRGSLGSFTARALALPSVPGGGPPARRLHRSAIGRGILVRLLAHSGRDRGHPEHAYHRDAVCAARVVSVLIPRPGDGDGLALLGRFRQVCLCIHPFQTLRKS
jgi:hypothetical protein